MSAGSAAFGAFDAQFYVDVAPNKYLDPVGYGTWWAGVKAGIASGTYGNTQHGNHPGSLSIDPSEEAVYSFAPYGERTHWLYWVPGVSVSEFQSHNLQGKMRFDFAGVAYTYDWDSGGALVEDGPTVGWKTVGNFEAFNGGVIGTFGHAWWVGSGYVSPSPDAYQARDADLNSLIGTSTWVEGLIQFTASDPQTDGIRVSVTPEPASFLLIGTALAGMILRRRFRKSQSH